MILATKTLAAIDAALEADDGRTYRGFLKEALLACSDGFSTKVEGPREHLGCSLLGKKCSRQLWYGFRWASYNTFPGRIHRLFNRGHLEEGRFVALLRMIDCTVLPHDPQTGKQFRIKGHLGHVGGSLDGVVRGLPDLAIEMWALQEFKTHNDKSFKKIHSDGVREAKFEHYVQQQLYMNYYDLSWSFYGAVNKNDDDLHLELVENDRVTAPQYMDRGATIVEAETPPTRISESPGWFECKFCSDRDICHGNKKMAVNCRTCIHAKPVEGGAWLCCRDSTLLNYDKQLTGCKHHAPIKG